MPVQRIANETNKNKKKLPNDKNGEKIQELKRFSYSIFWLENVQLTLSMP